MRVTLNLVNAELRKRGYDVELHRGRGYFYFSGGYLYDPSVMVFRLSVLSVDQWVREYERRLAETNAKTLLDGDDPCLI